ncbi:MAG: adenylosuccinate lyase [Synechococcaceae bacterium WB9_2_170]|nr:adenylosuccinate lyase [Synechococcaceae bacterium WB9_2_170]
MFWTPYADWIFTGVSTSLLLIVMGLVLRPPR